MYLGLPKSECYLIQRNDKEDPMIGEAGGKKGPTIGRRS